MNEDLAGANLGKSWRMLTMNTLAFTVCFAVWMMNGVLVTFFINNGLQKWDASAMGWMIGIPVLSGSIMRLPIGLLTDRYGGRIVFGTLLLLSAIPTYMMSACNTYQEFFWCSLGFGMAGTGFAVGIAYTSVWFPKKLQGTALGIFGVGNAGAALTSFGAPVLLKHLTNNFTNLEAWRMMPKIYAAALVTIAVLFILLTENRVPPGSESKSLGQRLEPLRHMRVWRFGLYYFFVFGGFVALAQWLVPYYVNVYSTTLALAGTLAAVNSLPSGLIRALGGWLSDLKGARAVLYWVLGVCLICSAMLIVPQMDIRSPGGGIMARAGGKVIEVTDTKIVVMTKGGPMPYKLRKKTKELVTDKERHSGLMIWPRSQWWNEPAVKVGQKVKPKSLLARGETHIFFQANIWIFTFISFTLGVAMGIGKAAVYKYIPEYFPQDVGVVGGIVGVLGGLGGFVCPILFGNMLKATGLWTTCWMFFFALTAICLFWLHIVVTKINKDKANEVTRMVENGPIKVSR